MEAAFPLQICDCRLQIERQCGSSNNGVRRYDRNAEWRTTAYEGTRVRRYRMNAEGRMRQGGQAVLLTYCGIAHDCVRRYEGRKVRLGTTDTSVASPGAKAAKESVKGGNGEAEPCRLADPRAVFLQGGGASCLSRNNGPRDSQRGPAGCRAALRLGSFAAILRQVWRERSLIQGLPYIFLANRGEGHDL